MELLSTTRHCDSYCEWWRARNRQPCFTPCLYRIQALEGLLTKATQSAAAQPQASKAATAVDSGPSTAAPDSAQLSAQTPTAMARGGSAFLVQPSIGIQAATASAQDAPGQAVSSANSEKEQDPNLITTAASASQTGQPSSDVKAAGDKGLTAPGSFSA